MLKSNLVFFKNIFRDFCHKNDYKWFNVELLGILQYFSICTLYDDFKDGKYGRVFIFIRKVSVNKINE